MEYTETNKLISKFVNDCEMGVYSEDGDFIHSSICGVDADSAFYRWEDMKFHTSWDWLMPVIEKIEGMGYKFQMCRRRVTIKTDTNEIELFDTKGHSKLDASYESVSKFINWYNSKQ